MPITTTIGTRIWRPVRITAPARHGGFRTYSKLAVTFGTGKRGSALCRATDLDAAALPGELVVRNPGSPGLCVFVEEEVPQDWTHLVVVSQLKGSVLAEARGGDLSTLYNVYPDIERRRRINVVTGAPLPAHTSTFVFVGDAVRLLTRAVGNGRAADGKCYAHSAPRGTKAIVEAILNSSTVRAAWVSDGLVFTTQVGAADIDVLRG